MRPSKIHIWIKAFKDFTESTNMFYIYTDNDIRLEVNSRLDKEQRICKSTFKNWKAGQCKQAEEFGNIIQMVSITQKENLMRSLIQSERNWTKYAWILERKFSEWNLKNISVIKNNLTTQIEPIKIELVDANN